MLPLHVLLRWALQMSLSELPDDIFAAAEADEGPLDPEAQAQLDAEVAMFSQRLSSGTVRGQ